MARGLLKVSKGFNVPRFRLKHHIKKKCADGKKYKKLVFILGICACS
jgi:hypothetical protein